MASVITKRQQARNERALQDLIRSVPGNDRCADCAAKNPGWASWNLGVFLCMRCAALHRKLGTHVSKVKSLSMDSWSTEQVDGMKKVGNIASNKIYNPQNVRPDIPVDADEVDGAVERYIRQKYDLRTLSKGNAPAARQNTGSTGTDMGSWSEEPPDLPPKPTKKFGFSLRSSSSTFPRQKSDRFTPPLSPAYTGSDRSAERDLPSPKRDNKPSRLFGMKITTVDNNFNAKLTHLRDMGFGDNSRNAEMLKSMNGNLDKTVEELIRLGENSRPLTRTVTPAPRALTPVSMKSSGINGISMEKRMQDPWDIREETKVPPPRSSSVPPTAAPASSSWNPFLSSQPAPPQQTLENSFQNLSVSATSSSGPHTLSNQQAYYQNTTIQQPSNPWQAPQPFQQPTPQQGYGQQYQQAPSLQASLSSNPFMQQPAQVQSLSPSNPWAQQAPQQQAAPAPQQQGNPFGAPWQQQTQSSTLSQQPFAASPQPIYGQQPDFFSAAPQQPSQQPQQQQSPFEAQQTQQYSAGNVQNPWQQQQQQQQQPMQTQPTGMPQQQYQIQPQQQQTQYGQFGQQLAPGQQAQHPSRHDKSSILALYGYPQLAPQRPLQTLPEDGTMPLQQAVPQRSATMPVSSVTGSMNPFVQGPTQPQGFGHASQQSVDFQGFANSGRHSPDAFSGLSARYMR
ncbi:UBA domain-containing 3 [Lecanosticta acicola]|uniref:UBA domain-containing 3 n=1 Tax=Lecanosticta acicola TaxID=111012 RepID=A0AAI9EAS5_9PEZI|nr:UBA domain-containing 3 [Lecanosticta acicola]